MPLFLYGVRVSPGTQERKCFEEEPFTQSFHPIQLLLENTEEE